MQNQPKEKQPSETEGEYVLRKFWPWFAAILWSIMVVLWSFWAAFASGLAWYWPIAFILLTLKIMLVFGRRLIEDDEERGI